MSVTVRREPLSSPVAARLIGALNAELTARYPEDGATHFRLDETEVAPAHGAFLAAFRDGEPIGCGAVRRIDATAAELKRMFVDPRGRGTGVGRALLTALIVEAERLGVTRLVLETGRRQAEAIGLYESAGFVHVAPFGEYVGSPLSVCMELAL